MCKTRWCGTRDKKARLRARHMCMCVQSVAVVHVLLARAVLRSASQPRRACRIAFIASMDCEPKRPRVRCVARVRGARDCARVQRALGVRAVVHVVTRSFFARGDDATATPRCYVH